MAGLKVAILGPKIAKKWGFFRPSNLLGGTYEHPYSNKLVQPILRRVAKFRENRPRDVENLVNGNFFF